MIVRDPVGVFAQRLDGALLGRAADENSAVTVAHRQHALHLKGDQRLTQRGPAHAELCREIPLGGQTFPGDHLVVGDVRAQLLNDHFVQPWSGHRPQLLYH